MAFCPPSSETHTPPPVTRTARRVARMARNPILLEAMSWVLWVVVVAGFAVWTLWHYQAPAKPAWLGMTIRTTVFGIWALIVREWASLRFYRNVPPTNDGAHNEAQQHDSQHPR